MKVPVRLVKRTEAAPAEAFLLFAESAQPLVDAFARGTPTPEIFRVGGGFVLIYPAHPLHEPRAAIRLRKLGGHFYLPADADIRPTFLPEEVIDLTKKRGLVAMPGGTFLAFDPQAPLMPEQWLSPPPVRRNAWEPIPPAPFQPDRLTRIEYVNDSPAAVIEILNEGAPDDADPLPGQGSREGTDAPVPEEARPPGAGTMARVGAGATFATGQFLAWLGRQFRMPNLANLGGNLARRAVQQVPRLTEKILGAQEAALREVLRQLQSGDAEKALRRAPIAVSDPNDPPARVSDTANLGNVDPRYSLRSLLGGGGSGPGSVWLGGGDVWALLANEYRRLAQEALARGDFRRAAYLYGVLLRDYRSAANALASGGLHKDAAIIYRDKLFDLPAAAQAFERAGNSDEALRLYEQMERYEEAAEMLRRMGDEERAGQLYLRAAAALAGKGRWLAAGDLVRNKVGRHDLAGEYYNSGWKLAGAEVVPCGQRLLDQSLAAEEWSKAEELFAEGEEKFTTVRVHEANEFFNYALRAKEFLPPERHGAWQDRVRMLFADHTRSSSKSMQVAGELFADRRNWPPEVLRDAVFAARRRSKVPAPVKQPETALKLLDGTVVAVAVARDSRDVVIASTTAVVCWRVKEQRVIPIHGSWVHNEVIGLSVDARAENVFVLFEPRGGVVVQSIQGAAAVLVAGASDSAKSEAALQNFLCNSNGEFIPGGIVDFRTETTERHECYILPNAFHWDEAATEAATIVANRHGHFAFRGHIPKAFTASLPPHRSTADFIAWGEAAWDAWYWDVESLRYCNAITEREWSPPWRPESPAGHACNIAPADSITEWGKLEVAGLDNSGVLWRSGFDAAPDSEPRSEHAWLTHADRFAAVCLLKAETVAAVTFRNELIWLRVQSGKLEPYAASTQLQVPSQAVFLAARPQAGEVAVILEDGSAVLVPMP